MKFKRLWLDQAARPNAMGPGRDKQAINPGSLIVIKRDHPHRIRNASLAQPPFDQRYLGPPSTSVVTLKKINASLTIAFKRCRNQHINRLV
jgi:hypothetical protein